MPSGYELSVKKYIKQKPKEVIPHEQVLQSYKDALMRVQRAEERMRKLLIEGGYVSE